VTTWDDLLNQHLEDRKCKRVDTAEHKMHGRDEKCMRNSKMENLIGRGHLEDLRG
jgi:hypothetical protein